MIDASDVVLGRLASQAAQLLRGKHKPQFAPHVDTGDFVVIVNAGKVAMTGNKRERKFAYRHSGYPGGLRKQTVGELLRKRPERVVEKAVSGMLPHNTLGRSDVTQAQGLRRPRAPARRAAARRRSRSPRSRSRGSSVTEPMTRRRTCYDSTRPVQTVGRRKEAIVRVRLMPGTGQFTLNGRTLEKYFPNKVHQQLIREPLVTLEKAEQLRRDRAASRAAASPARPARCGSAIARALIELEATTGRR